MSNATNLTQINNIQEALDALGVTQNSLSAPEKQALDEQGYVILRDLIDPPWLEQLRTAFEQCAEQERQEAGQTGKQEQGTRHPGNLINQNVAFERVYTHPRLLGAVYHILKREFKLGSLAGRDPLPGYGQQGLHADWGERGPAEPYQVATTIWLLDDFTPDNGATRLVPGSHLMTKTPVKQVFGQPTKSHPNEVLAVAPAGSVLIFNGHTWHSGTLNRSKVHRRALQGVFSAQRLYGQPTLEPDTLARISPAARYILGI